MSYGLCADEPRLRAKQQQLAAKEFSAGVIAFYWAVNKRCPELAHHNVFLSGAAQRMPTASTTGSRLFRCLSTLACRMRQPLGLSEPVNVCRCVNAWTNDCAQHAPLMPCQWLQHVGGLRSHSAHGTVVCWLTQRVHACCRRLQKLLGAGA